jgi:hypothetical protein
MKIPHKHAAIIHAFAEGFSIEYFSIIKQEWLPIENPCFQKNISYRIKFEWYEDIPETGVICWVWDEPDDSKQIAIINDYYSKSNYPYVETRQIGNTSWKNAVPLTKEEVLKRFFVE